VAATEADVPPLPADVGEAEHVAGRKNLVQLVQLRWLAVGGQLLTILCVRYLLDIRLPLAEMLALLGGLALFNAVCAVRARTANDVEDPELFAGLLVDMTVLSGQLFYSGGVTNPFIFLFQLQVVVAAVLLKPHYSWAMVLLTSGCFVALTQWHRPLDLPGLAQEALSIHYVGGLLICFALVASLLVLFIGRIGRNLRQRDERLANLRQRAAEEEHIVRIGLLASGAAHELGTPLATLSVILGDWSRMAVFAGEPELREEIEEMQVQIQRCKRIVSGILLAAGETRGEAPVETTLHAFLDDFAAQWLRTRAAPGLRYGRDGVPDLPIVSDTALQQMIGNVLDNALEAAPQAEPTLWVQCEDDELILHVQDRGPGFAPEMLAQLGKPYQSSKGRPGGGLGLFLSVNVARLLGGRLQARNREGGGAEVTIRLPLAALALPEASAHGH
jgi:two-component system sensor histidine kinase RegB